MIEKTGKIIKADEELNFFNKYQDGEMPLEDSQVYDDRDLQQQLVEDARLKMKAQNQTMHDIDMTPGNKLSMLREMEAKKS